MTTKIAQAENLARSAIAPLISATVMIANISWKATNTYSGRVPYAVAALMLSRPRRSNPPSQRFPPGLNANE